MQLERPSVMRRRCNGKTAAPAARQQDVDVLAWREVEIFRNGQAQEQSHDVVRQGNGALDAARQALELGGIGGAQFKSFDRKIGARTRLAQQDQTVGNLGIRKSQRRSMRIVNLAAQEAGLAGAAIAAFAAMRQIERGICSGFE